MILNPVDMVHMDTAVVSSMPQAVLRSASLVMFCESDLIHSHQPLQGPTKQGAMKGLVGADAHHLYLDTQVKTMMQTKHALMALEVATLISDNSLAEESVTRANNIAVRLLLCRTRSPLLVKLMAAMAILLASSSSSSSSSGSGSGAGAAPGAAGVPSSGMPAPWPVAEPSSRALCSVVF